MVTIKKFGVLSVGVMCGILSAIGGFILGLIWAGMFSLIYVITEAYGGAYGGGSSFEDELGWMS